MLHFASKVCCPEVQPRGDCRRILPELIQRLPVSLPGQAGADGLEAARQATKAVKALLKDKMTDPDVRNPYTDMTPLHCAAFFGFAEGIKVGLQSASL